MKKNFGAITFAMLCLNINACVFPTDSVCRKPPANPPVKTDPPLATNVNPPPPITTNKPPEMPPPDYGNKLIKHLLILNDSVVMELKTDKSSVLFDGKSVIGFYAQSLGSQCALHIVKIYDLDENGAINMLYLDGKFFQTSRSSATGLAWPLGYSEDDARKTMLYAAQIFSAYGLIFKEKRGIEQKEGASIKEIHDLYIERYWEFYRRNCKAEITLPNTGDLALFDLQKH